MVVVGDLCVWEEGWWVDEYGWKEGRDRRQLLANTRESESEGKGL